MTGTEDQLISYIEEKRSEFESLEPEQLAFPRTANTISKFRDSVTMFVKGTPQHIRGCIMFNHMIKERDLEHKYNTILDGEKIKYLKLKAPNPAKQDVISFISELPREFDLIKYIDYDTMYQKSFLDPLKAILDVIGWHTEKTASLEDFFS